MPDADKETPEIRAVLFDKDGTLVDYYAMWGPAYRAAADDLAVAAGDPALASCLLRMGGYDPDSGRVAPTSTLACGTTDDIVRLWSSVEAIAALPDLKDRVLATFAGYAVAEPQPLTDLGALFERLRRRGLKLGVATSDSADNARGMLEGFRVDHLLDFVAGYDSGYGVKPHPGVMQAFCVQTGMNAAQVAMVGDSLHDMQLARAAGAGLAIGVLSGVSPRALLAGVADHVLDDVSRLEGLLFPS